MDANRTSRRYELRDALARSALPTAVREAGLKLAWTNSVCILVLVIGLAGGRRGRIDLQPAPPLAEAIPVMLEPVTLPAQPEVREKASESRVAAAPAVVIPDAPNISFSVPTMGVLVAPANLAAAPPLEPMAAPAALQTVSNTGEGGERPAPPYPRLAQQAAEEGTVTVVLTADAAGNVVAVELKETSGFPILDRATVDFVKKHWRLPAGGGLFQTRITYKLQL